MLKDKHFLITSGAGRIGSSISRFLLHHGAHLALHYFQSEKEARLLQKEFPSQVTLYQADFRQDLFPFIQRIKASIPKLDGILLNSFSFERSPFGSTSEALYDEILL